MRKTPAALLVALIFCSTAVAYVPPTKNLVIVEVDTAGAIEKKVADEKTDLLFSRELKTIALFDKEGVEGYKAVFTLNLKNVSPRRLESISLIEMIPEELAKSPELVESEADFVFLEGSRIIKFPLGTMEQGTVKGVSYSIKLAEENQAEAEKLFQEMEIPIALIPITEQDCTGIKCNDFNPCTVDQCIQGECEYEIAPEGIACGQDMVCVQGSCEKFRNADLLVAASAVIIVIVVVSTLLIYKAKRAGR